MTCFVYATGPGLPSCLIPFAASGPTAEDVGTIACSPLAVPPGVIVNVRTRATESHGAGPKPNDDVLRPSSHWSICRADTTGTPACTAAPTMASETADAGRSVCAFTVNAP